MTSILVAQAGADLTGKVYIVTGGNSGIGYYTVARLAQHGVYVYLCARSPTKGSAAITSIKSLYPQAHITLLEMDHLSLSTVVSAAKLFLSIETILHGLINNAGIMATPFEMTKDKHETQWQTNYLAHWVFTSHLLPLMLSTFKTLPSGSVRIVNLSSSGHFSAPKGGINFTDTSLPNGDGMARYGQSKLANILHAKTLNKLYGHSSPSSKAGKGEIWTATMHLGLVKSQLGVRAEISIALKMIVVVANAIGMRMDADTGSWTSVFCAASPEIGKEQSGTLFSEDYGGRMAEQDDEEYGPCCEVRGLDAEEMMKEGWVK